MISPTNIGFLRFKLSIHTRFFLYIILALIALITDQHYHVIDIFRQPIDAGVYSAKLAAQESNDFFKQGYIFFTDRITLQQNNDQLRTQVLQLKNQLWQQRATEHELAELKTLFILTHGQSSRTCIGRLYGEHDPFKQQLIFNKGKNFQLQSGQPVVDANGLLGQIAAVYPTLATIRLIVDKGYMTPVMVERTGERAFLYGNGSGLYLPYWSLQSDIQPNDHLVTSGIDGVYPPGLPVATVRVVSRDRGAHFSGLVIQPLAGMGRSRYGLALTPHTKQSFFKSPSPPKATDSNILKAQP